MTTLDNEIVSVRDTHNHPPDAAEMEAEKVIATIKEKAKESINPVPAVYDRSEVQHLASRADRDEVAAKLPTFNSVKSSLYHSR